MTALGRATAILLQYIMIFVYCISETSFWTAIERTSSGGTFLVTATRTALPRMSSKGFCLAASSANANRLVPVSIPMPVCESFSRLPYRTQSWSVGSRWRAHAADTGASSTPLQPIALWMCYSADRDRAEKSHHCKPTPKIGRTLPSSKQIIVVATFGNQYDLTKYQCVEQDVDSGLFLELRKQPKKRVLHWRF